MRRIVRISVIYVSKVMWISAVWRTIIDKCISSNLIYVKNVLRCIRGWMIYRCISLRSILSFPSRTVWIWFLRKIRVRRKTTVSIVVIRIRIRRIISVWIILLVIIIIIIAILVILVIAIVIATAIVTIIVIIRTMTVVMRIKIDRLSRSCKVYKIKYWPRSKCSNNSSRMKTFIIIILWSILVTRVPALIHRTVQRLLCIHSKVQI